MITATLEETEISNAIKRAIDERGEQPGSALQILAARDLRAAGYEVPQQGQWVEFRRVLGRLVRSGTIVHTGTRTTRGFRSERYYSTKERQAADVKAQTETADTVAGIRARVRVGHDRPGEAVVFVDSQPVAEFVAVATVALNAGVEAEEYAEKVRRDFVRMWQASR